MCAVYLAASNALKQRRLDGTVVRGGGGRMAIMAEGVMRYCARKVGYAAGFDVEIYEEHDERAKQVRKPCSELSAATTQNMALALPPPES